MRIISLLSLLSLSCLSATTWAHEVKALPSTIIPAHIDAKLISGEVQIFQGGYGSDMARDPHNPQRFYALTDRGPNADYTGELGKGKMFPVPNYTPRIGWFEIAQDGQIIKLKDILLKDKSGKAITGLPNVSGLGGSGEIVYGPNGQLLVENPLQAYNEKNNPNKTDSNGLDPEGLVVLNDGTFWISDEYGPHIVHFDAQGRELERINPFVNDKRNKFVLPAEYSYRRPNRGMEGLTITPDQNTLVGVMQSTMRLPDKSVQQSDLTRIVTIDLRTGKTKQYLYQQEQKGHSNSAIKYLKDNRFLVLERDSTSLRDNNAPFKRIYEIDLAVASDIAALKPSSAITYDAKLGVLIDGLTPEQVVLDKGWAYLAQQGIKPVPKKLYLDLLQESQYPFEKFEGIWLLEDGRIATINDNDFALRVENGKIVQKYIDKNNSVIEGSELYIYPARK